MHVNLIKLQAKQNKTKLNFNSKINLQIYRIYALDLVPMYYSTFFQSFPYLFMASKNNKCSSLIHLPYFKSIQRNNKLIIIKILSNPPSLILIKIIPYYKNFLLVINYYPLHQITYLSKEYLLEKYIIIYLK